MEIKFFKNKKKFKKGGSSIKPNFYWMCILFATFVLISVSLAFGLYLFLQTNKEPVPGAVNENEVQIINKDKLNKVLGYFSDREKKSKEILKNPSPIVDPSL